jgi:hypothetical protein
MGMRNPVPTAKTAPAFQTACDIARYYGGKTIKCLLCGRQFRRLAFHLAAKHDISSVEYKRRFGLPWSRGLTSASSHSNSGWTDQRRVKASQAARRTQFFKFAHPVQRRELAPYQRTQLAENLGKHTSGFGRRFERRVRTLFDKGLTDGDIARILDVNRMTVNRRTKYWRKPNKMKSGDRRTGK